MYKSEDGGTSWSEVNDGLSRFLFVDNLVLDPQQPQRLYSAMYETGLYRSENGGRSWSDIRAGLPDAWVSALEVDPRQPRRLYAALHGGVYRSEDGGDNWALIDEGLAATSVNALALDDREPQTLYAGTGAGVFSITFQRETAVREERTAALPRALTLGQNYPNPFNNRTAIRFALPHEEWVELALYDLAGQKVATLVSGARMAGFYAVHWDGRDDRGRAVASGAYLYRLETGASGQITRKLLLVK